MTKQILLSALFVLAANEASCFIPRRTSMPSGVWKQKIASIHQHTAPLPLYAVLDPETNVKVKSTPGWKQQVIQVLDVNGDGRVDHKDAGAVAALACLSWSLMASPAMAKGSSSHSSSSHSSSSRSSSPRSSSSRSSSSRSSSARSSLSTSSPSIRPSSSSSVSSSSSRKSSSTYQRSSTISSQSSRSSSPSVSKITTSSSSSKSTPTPSTSSTSKPSYTSKSVSPGDRVTMASPKRSSARLNIKSRTKSKSAVVKNASSTPTTMTTTYELSSSTPTSSISSSTKKNSSTKASSTMIKAKTTPIKVVNENKASSNTAEKRNTKIRSGNRASELSSSIKPSSTPTSSISSSTKKNSSTKASSTMRKAKTTPTKVVNENKVSSNTAEKRNTKIRSGKRVGGRAAKRNDSREPIQESRDPPVVIERNTYIVQPPVSTPSYYGSSRAVYSEYPRGSTYNAQPETYSQTNSGVGVLGEQEQQYPPYKRPMAPKNCIPKQQKTKCKCDLPYDGEPIDVLVDPVQGLYVRGGVTFVDAQKCDFTVTIFSSADGKPVKKSLHAISLDQFAKKNAPKAQSKQTKNTVLKK